MVLFNYSTKELTAKIVYYGPGLCGKTTNLQYIHQNLSENVKGKMLSLATKTDRTLFFDFLPMDLGEIRGMKTRMQLYTVPGQVFYNETRKLVLKGVDGIVFVADSQQEMLNPNIESFKNLEENLKTHGLSLEEIPHVIQFNKSDLPKLSTIEELNNALNKFNAPFYESVATTGIGVQDTLKAITKLVLLNLTQRYQAGRSATATKPVSAPVLPLAASPATGKPDPLTIPLQVPAPTAPRMAASAIAERTIGQTGGAGTAMSSAYSSASTELPKVALVADDDGIIDQLVDEVQDSPLDSRPTDHLASEMIAELGTLSGSSGRGETADEALESSADLGAESFDDTEAASYENPLVKLTEVLEDHELFDDPSLDVAKLASGEQREIVIPVELGAKGQTVRRFKLSLKLRLDPVD